MRVLDLGAYAGYFAVRLVEDFDAHVVAVDDHPPLRKAASDRITVINHRMNADQIDALGDFDAVLLLSVLHHAPNWRRILEVVCRRSTLLYLETPDPSEHLPRAAAHTPALAAAVERLGGQVLTRTAGYRSTTPRELRAICLR
ncbi:class I SAM-dependent methyltransferase [Nocardiopsis sp. CNT-189]